MVPGNAIGQQMAYSGIVSGRNARAPGGVVHAQCAALQPKLVGLGVLAQVMQPALYLSQLTGTEGLCELSSQCAHTLQMIRQGLPIGL